LIDCFAQSKQHAEQHERREKNRDQGAFEWKSESGKREVKKRGATLGRHITSLKSRAEVSADRSAKVKSVRVKREKENFGK
jgi:hypothetical protein